MAQVDLKKATIVIDGSEGNQITVKIGEGNLTYLRKQTVKYLSDRGKLDTAILGDEVPMEVSIDAIWENITGDNAIVTIEDAITHQGLAANWKGTDADTEAAYAVDIRVHLDFPCTVGNTQDEQLVLKHFRWETFAHDLKAGTFAITGKCNQLAPTATRL